jgi:uncharacterized membrane protein YfcA
MVDIMWSFLVGLVCTGIADMFWTLYTKATTKHSILPASTWSSCIVLIGVIDTYVFIRYPISNGLGSIIGAFIGTYLTLRLLPNEEI